MLISFVKVLHGFGQNFILHAEDSRDLGGMDLCADLKISCEMIPDSILAVQRCLRYIRTIRDSFTKMYLLSIMTQNQTVHLNYFVNRKATCFNIELRGS